MRLLLDMGNSRLKSAVLTDTGELTQFISIAYEQRQPIEALTDHLNRYNSVDCIVLVSVLGGRFHQEVVALLESRHIALHWVTSESHMHGVTNHYRKPEQLGSDRFVALVAARQAFPKQCCIVVDCGTAVTIDALTEDGEFCGGVIIPGLKLWSDSLIGRANQLSGHQIQDTELFAKDTAQAIGSGSVFGLTSAIEGIFLRMSGELQSATTDILVPKLVICGGDAELIGQYSRLEFELMPHLVLMGLAEYT